MLKRGGAVALVIGWASLFLAFSSQVSAAGKLPRFEACDVGQTDNCVVDGITFWLNGEKLRLAGLAEVPSVEHPGCIWEAKRAKGAVNVLIELFKRAGPRPVITKVGQDGDVSLVTVTTADGDLVPILIGMGMALVDADREYWCR